MRPGSGGKQDPLREHDLFGLLAQRVQPGDPGEVVLAGQVADLGAHLSPQTGDLVGRLLAQVSEVGRGVKSGRSWAIPDDHEHRMSKIRGL